MLNNIFEEIITMSLKDINNNLQTISKIKPDEKLYHYENNLYLEDSYVPSIKRWYRGSSRTDTNIFIKYILTQAFFQSELLKKRYDDESVNLHNALLNNLKSAINGLQNLKETYKLDDEFCFKIDKNIKYINKFFS